MEGQDFRAEYAVLKSDLDSVIACMDLLPTLSRRRIGKGFVNSFVSGLVLSSAIMEKVENQLLPDYKIAWGQILDENDRLSGEIDMMIYMGKPLHEWKNIKYALIRKSYIIKIFEIKKNFRSYPEHERDYKHFKKFAKWPHTIFLIIYQSPNTMNGIAKQQEKLKHLGYEDVFHLVRISKKSEEKDALYDNWYRLIKTVREYP